MTSAKNLLVPLVLMSALAGPVAAQQGPAPTAAECQSMFKAADLNNDGTLSRDEIAASEDLKDFYAGEENLNNLTLGRFMADCQGS